MNFLPTSVALCLLAALPAQTQAAASPRPHVLIDTVGPDGWRARLGPTNLGSLLESEQGRSMWQPQMLPLFGLWQQLAGDDTTFAAAKARMLGFAGRVRFGVWLHEGKLEHQGVARLLLVIDGDGRTDLTTLATDLRQLQKSLPGTWADQELGGAKVAVLAKDDDAMTAPTVVGNSLVVAMSSADELATAFTEGQRWAAAATGKPPAPTTPALQVEVDIAAIVALAKAAGDADEAKLMDTCGLDSLGRLTATIGGAGPHVQFELAQHFTPAPRGLFAAFFPPVQGLPALQQLAPKDAASWRLGHCDFQALYDTVLAVLVSLFADPRQDVRAEMKEELGIDVGPDLIAHMTTEVAVIGSPLAGLDRPNDFTWTIAVLLRDELAFAKSLDTLLLKSKPTLSREATTTIGGIECHRYGNMFGYDLWFAVGQRTFLLAGGRDAEDQLTTAITALQASLTAAPTPGAAVTAFTDLAKVLPPGPNGMARGDLDSLFAVPTEWWSLLLRELLPFGGGEPVDDPEAREKTRALLKEHHLGSVRTATGYADSVWRWRLFW